MDYPHMSNSTLRGLGTSEGETGKRSMMQLFGKSTPMIQRELPKTSASRGRLYDIQSAMHSQEL